MAERQNGIRKSLDLTIKDPFIDGLYANDVAQMRACGMGSAKI